MVSEQARASLAVVERAENLINEGRSAEGEELLLELLKTLPDQSANTEALTLAESIDRIHPRHRTLMVLAKSAFKQDRFELVAPWAEEIAKQIADQLDEKFRLARMGKPKPQAAGRQKDKPVRDECEELWLWLTENHNGPAANEPKGRTIASLIRGLFK